MAGDRTFDPWSVNIINDTNFEVRKSMEIWMNAMNAHSIKYWCYFTIRLSS